MSDLMKTAEALMAFAEYVVADRGIQNLTQDQAEQIAEHALRNLGQITAAYELGIRND